MSLANFRECLGQFDVRMTVLLEKLLNMQKSPSEAEIACYVPYNIIINKYLYFLIESILKFKPLKSEENKRGLEMKQQ